MVNGITIVLWLLTIVLRQCFAYSYLLLFVFTSFSAWDGPLNYQSVKSAMPCVLNHCYPPTIVDTGAITVQNDPYPVICKY